VRVECASLKLTDANHFSMIRIAQLRFAPTAIGITRNGDRHQIAIGDRLRRRPQIRVQYLQLMAEGRVACSAEMFAKTLDVLKIESGRNLTHVDETPSAHIIEIGYPSSEPTIHCLNDGCRKVSSMATIENELKVRYHLFLSRSHRKQSLFETSLQRNRQWAEFGQVITPMPWVRSFRYGDLDVDRKLELLAILKIQGDADIAQSMLPDKDHFAIRSKAVLRC